MGFVEYSVALNQEREETLVPVGLNLRGKAPHTAAELKKKTLQIDSTIVGVKEESSRYDFMPID